MRSLLVAFLFFFSLSSLCAQTLFTYGTHSVSKTEFLNAYWKNKTDSIADKQSLLDYLELYTRYKLKVKAAYDLHLDTLPNQRADLETFRRQIEGSYLIDSSAFEKLVDEAFERSLADIRLSMIVIPFDAGFKAYQFATGMATGQDSASALAKVTEVQSRLKKGESFESLAKIYSGDTTAARNNGDIGYITVFSLPYPIENVAYSLKNGEVSAPIVTKAGYILLKKTDERPAMGKLQLSQILIAVDPEALATTKLKKKALADSLYTALQKGNSFDSLAREFSDDKMTLANGGVMPEFGVGKYEPLFESKAFALDNDGAISAPFETQFGFHIIKRNARLPVNKNRETAKAALKAEVMEDNRNKVAKTILEEKLMKQTGVEQAPYDQKTLWTMTDTFLAKDKILQGKKIKSTDVLFSFPKQKITVADWLKYARARSGKTATGTIDYKLIMPDFLRQSVINYYQEHLEDFNPNYRLQLTEFKEGNLLFEVMEKQVWNQAAMDEKGLKQHYEKNLSKYVWGPGADAILFTCADKATAEKLRLQIRNNPSSWKMLAESSEGKINADSARFELMQLTTEPISKLNAKSTTPLLTNENDQTVTFSYIVTVYTTPAQRTFEDAKGLVINDYQSIMEEQWIAQLKKKYPVKINTTTLNSLLAETARR